MISPSNFSSLLKEWHQTITRDMPWKADRDPYKIWLSEIILQQTRVAQGTPYYLRFIDKFPDIKTLAKADEDTVLKLWQGLGYYSRARNILATAKIIDQDYSGVFPTEHGDILKLKGVGPYTAAAISSFAYGHSIPVIDGNVLRLMSRIHGIYEPIDHPNTHKTIDNLLRKAIKLADPAAFNQAIMDFGATVCTPKNPNCGECVFAAHCIAKANDDVNLLPIKSKSIKKTTRYFNYFVLLAPNLKQFVIEKRTENDIWKGLYQLPLYESQTLEDLSTKPLSEYFPKSVNISDTSTYEVHSVSTKKHILTHQTLVINFYVLEIIPYHIEFEGDRACFVSKTDYDQYPFPKVIADFLNDFFDF